MLNKKHFNFKLILGCLTVLCLAVILAGCSSAKSGEDEIPEIDGLEYESTLDLEYATEFKIYQYKGGYSYIHIVDSEDYLVIPEDGKIPENLPKDVVVLEKPLDNIYMAATSNMALANAVNGLDDIGYSSVEADDWYVEEAADAMNEGKIKYAGKYNTPDYEMLVGENCDLAIESTMILHNPEVKEKLEELGIKVLVEKSSYEKHPLGRTEWVKLYGVLLDKEEEAEKAFDAQKAVIDQLADIENTGKTVAFFYVNSNGGVVTRKSDDYVPTMIEIAGGEYIFDDLGDPEKKTSTVNMQMEEFYASAKDADYIFYNSSIVAPVNSMDELLELSPVLAEFKAVKEGNVWCPGKNLFQETDKLGGIIEDMSTILTTKDENLDTLDYFFKVK